MTTVTVDPVDPTTGAPVAGARIVVRLVCDPTGTVPGFTDGSELFPGPWYATTDDAGHADLDLPDVAAISPVGSFYVVSEPGGQRRIAPTGAGPVAVGDPSIQVVTPVPPGWAPVQGDAATVTVGTVTTGAPDSDATVTNSGTGTDAVLDFSIPRGETGPGGGGGGTDPSGPEGAIQRAVSGVFGGTSDLVYDSAAQMLSVMGAADGDSLEILNPTVEGAHFYVAGRADGTKTGVGHWTGSAEGELSLEGVVSTGNGNVLDDGSGNASFGNGLTALDHTNNPAKVATVNDLPTATVGEVFVDHTGDTYPITVDLTAVANSAGTGRPASILIGVPDATGVAGATLTVDPGDAAVGVVQQILILTPGSKLPAVAVVGIDEDVIPDAAATVRQFTLTPSAGGVLGGDSWTWDGFVGFGLTTLEPNAQAAIDGMGSYLDLNRFVATYMHDADVDPDWFTGPVASQPVGRDGHQIVNGEAVVVVGRTDGNWYLNTDADTGQWGLGGTIPFTGGAMFRTPTTSAVFQDATRPYGPETFSIVDSNPGPFGWMITPITIYVDGDPTGQPLGEEGWTAIDTSGLDVYRYTGGDWTRVGSLNA